MTCLRLASGVHRRGQLTYIHLYSALRAAHGGGSEGLDMLRVGMAMGEFGGSVGIIDVGCRVQVSSASSRHKVLC